MTVYDLNLTTAKGQGRLHARVKQAAEKLCVDREDRRLTSIQLGKQCIAEAITNASPQIERAIRHDVAARRSASLSLDTR